MTLPASSLNTSVAPRPNSSQGSTGVSKSRESARLRTHGVTLRRQGLTDEQVIEAANFYTADRSLAWLAVRYTVSPMTVSRALRHHGVTLRPRLVWS